MDSEKLRPSKDPDRSTTDVSDYVLDARDRLRRLASRAPGPAAPPAPIAAAAPAPNPAPGSSSPNPGTDEMRPEHEAPHEGLDNLRAAVVDRAVDRLVDRLLQQWERGGQPENRLDQYVVDRLVERLVSKLERT